MMHIVSGVGKRTVMRLGFMFGLLVIFAGWFAYDGWHTYPNRNRDAARQAFPQSTTDLPKTSRSVTESSYKALQADKPTGAGVSLADLKQRWGEPAYHGPAGEGSSEQVAIFVGPYGYVRAALDGDVASRVEWKEGAKSASDILVQKLLALVLGGISLIPLVLLLLQLSRKYVLDDEGLALPGTGRIPYDRMTGIDVADFNSKGIVRLKYRDQAGQEKVAALDEEQIARFDEIVAGVCEKKGWPIEVTPAGEAEDEDEAGGAKA